MAAGEYGRRRGARDSAPDRGQVAAWSRRSTTGRRPEAEPRGRRMLRCLLQPL